jgi:hypothetical protein
MKKSTIGGDNRTGIGRATDLAEQMIAATREFPPSADGDERGFVDMRLAYAKNGEPAGTMPPPSGLKQLAKAALRAATGAQPNTYLDKLGERLAFERAGTRLYEALIGKFETTLDGGSRFRHGPSQEDLVHIRAEELEHAMMVERTIRRLGGDPTAVTPSANLHATASKGLPATLTDPRTSFLECIEVILIAELVDNDCWTALIELAETAGDDEAVEQFRKALGQEQEHLEKVRMWLAAGQGRSVERARMLSSPQREATAASLDLAAGGEPRSVGVKRRGERRTGRQRPRRIRRSRSTSRTVGSRPRRVKASSRRGR